MSCPTQIAVLWAGVELDPGWMTFVTPILVSSLGGARAPVAQVGAKRTDVIWEVWEVSDHDTPIWAYLLGCRCAANGAVNDVPNAMGYVCVYICVKWVFLIINTKLYEVYCQCAQSSCHDESVAQER